MYSYEELTEPRQIRLLVLQPGTGDVHLTLQAVSLDDDLEYEAISYCWGDENDTRAVYCHGEPIQVTNSLASALLHLRSPDQPRTLWADAICINQKDKVEKGAQVQLMSQIYTKPKKVLIWLGDDTSGLEDVEKSISEALELMPPDEFDAEVIKNEIQKIFKEASRLRKEGKPNFNDHNWTPIANLLCRPWFERKWIIQEVIVADNDVPRVIICGNIQLPWRDFTSLCYRLGAYGILGSIAGFSVINSYAPTMASFFAENLRPIGSATNAWTIMLMKHFQSEITLLDLVMASFLFKCTDLRDHLYALLNLNSLGAGIEPDYHLSEEGVCKLFTTKTLLNDQNLKILSLVVYQPPTPDEESTGVEKLPSWVLDFRHKVKINPLVSYTIRPNGFHAGGKFTPPIEISADKRLLYLKGRLVDTVKATTTTSLEAAPLPTEDDIKPKKGIASMIKMWKRNWLMQCRDLASGGDWEGLPPARKREFYRTVLCGMVGMRDPASEEVVDAVEVYINYINDFFEPGYVLTDEIRDLMLTHGGLIESSLMGVGCHLHFCTTEEGRFGQVRPHARSGDLIYVILGAELPFVLRPTGEGAYTLIGECYIHGLMAAEALSDDRYETVDVVLE